MKTYQEPLPLFTPTQIMVQPEADAEFEALEIHLALWRHLHGDWGEWNCEQEPRWKAGQALDCYYLTESGYWLRLQTSADRGSTMIVIGDPEDDERAEEDEKEATGESGEY